MEHRMRSPNFASSTSDQHSTFFIHHGAETEPDESAVPAGVQTFESHSWEPAPPPRRSSRSILGYVTAKYTDSSSEADYSSPRSYVLPGYSTEERDAARRIPSERHIHGQGQRRAEANDAFRRLERDTTTTYRSDVWSFETSSDKSNADNLTPTKLIATPTQSKQELWLPVDSRQTLNGSTSSLREAKQLTNVDITERDANAAKHAPQPSVQTEVAVQFFSTQSADADGENHMICLGSSVQATTPHLPASEECSGHPSDECKPVPSAELQHGYADQQTAAQANLPNSLSQLSHLSHWSDEYDQFPSSQLDATVQQGFKTLSSCAQTSGSHAECQSELPLATEALLQKDNDLVEADGEALSTRPEVTGMFNTRGWSDTSHKPSGVDKDQPRDVSLDYTEPAASNQNYEPDTAIPNQFPPQINATVLNAQSVLDLLAQLEEQTRQLILKDQSRVDELGVAMNENVVLRKELQTAHQETADRDREIAYLRGQSLLLSTSSSSVPPIRSSGSPLDTLDTLVRQEQEEIVARGASPEISDSPNGSAGDVQNTPRFVSRAPLYGHVLPDQRIIPRSRPGSPPKCRPSLTAGRLRDSREGGNEAYGDSHPGEWQQGLPSQGQYANDVFSETGTTIYHETESSDGAILKHEKGDS